MLGNRRSRTRSSNSNEKPRKTRAPASPDTTGFVVTTAPPAPEPFRQMRREPRRNVHFDQGGPSNPIDPVDTYLTAVTPEYTPAPEYQQEEHQGSLILALAAGGTINFSSEHHEQFYENPPYVHGGSGQGNYSPMLAPRLPEQVVPTISAPRTHAPTVTSRVQPQQAYGMQDPYTAGRRSTDMLYPFAADPYLMPQAAFGTPQPAYGYPSAPFSPPMIPQYPTQYPYQQYAPYTGTPYSPASQHRPPTPSASSTRSSPEMEILREENRALMIENEKRKKKEKKTTKFLRKTAELFSEFTGTSKKGGGSSSS